MNVALLIEDESDEDGHMLLGLYQGVPLVERGVGYGVGVTMPDTITIYRLPTLQVAEKLVVKEGGTLEECVRNVVRDTIWHEIGHYFGHNDPDMYRREDEGTNVFKEI